MADPAPEVEQRSRFLLSCQTLFTGLYSGQYTLALRRLSWSQVLPPGASKGSGVTRLLQELNVEPQNLMALGDGENDVEMLQVCIWLILGEGDTSILLLHISKTPFLCTLRLNGPEVLMSEDQNLRSIR